MTRTADSTALVCVTRRGDGAVLRIATDRVDFTIAEALKARLKQAVPEGTGPVSIDISAVEFIDSSGLGALVALRKHLPKDRCIRLVGPGRFVDRVLRLTCLDRVFDISA